ncbi:hypothetical protein DH2020_027597 [Rehmannia glutinosa]|uniref:Uncharacterized protein n=1 Tax=Rehmannia glutinosa TaxID=99300 RepID=A0ABR0VTR0_REHGL
MATLPETKQDAETTLPDAWDYKGRPARKSSSGGWSSAAMILGVEACERLTTLGIAVNLVTYLTGTMHLGSATSANNVTNFLGTSFMLSLLGGFVADTYLGSLRPPKCTAGSQSCIPASGKQLMVLYMGLYLTALGTGGLKSSVSGFGSDQFDEGDIKERKQMIKFFNWFFFCINIGSLGAVTVLVYIQDNLGREWGYGICACAIVVGLVVFLSGTRRYRFKKLVGSPLTQIAAVFVAAWRKRRLELPSDSSLLFNVDDIVSGGGEGQSKKKKQMLPHSKDFRFLDKAAIKPQGSTNGITTANNKCLTDVEEVKLVIRMLPTWATTILFWTVYAQMTTFSVSQATTMNRHIGKSFEIPGAALTAFFVAGILLTVPIYDRVIVPICRRILKNPHGLSPLQRIGVGLVLSILAMVAAALTEVKRLQVARSHGLAHDPTSTVPLSVFWLVPQFLLVGSGEAFTYIGQLDFFLRECPKGMKTMSTGLFLSTLSLGFFFSSILVTVVHKVTGHKKPWLADNLNEGKLYDFYWLLTILSVFNLAIFLYFARRYVYKEKRLAEEGIELEETDVVCH